MSADAPHVLVIRRRYLGDIVLLGPVFRNLRLHWPAAQITALTEAPYTGVLALNPDVNRALTFPRRLFQWPAFLRALRAARFTHVLDFDNTEKTAVLTRVTGALIRVAFDRELIKFRYPSFYTHSAKVTNAFYDSHSITETYLQLLAPIGVPVATREVKLVPRTTDLAAARKLAPRGGKKILVHPGSRSAPPRLAGRPLRSGLRPATGRTTGSGFFWWAAPPSRRSCRKFDPTRRPTSSRSTDHYRSERLPRSPRNLMGSSAMTAAPMHVAAAVGTPVVALFGSQNATIWRPNGDRHTVLQTPLPCACIGHAAPTPCVKGDGYRSYCVRMLTVDEVFDAVAVRL